MGILQTYSVERLEQLAAACRDEIERYEREAAEHDPCDGCNQIINGLRQERAAYVVELGNRR